MLGLLFYLSVIKRIKKFGVPHAISPHSLPKIIFLDIGDTLYIKDEQRIPQSVKPALLALKNQGVLVCNCHRSHPGIIPIEVRKLIDEVGIDYLLTMNGQYNEFRW